MQQTVHVNIARSDMLSHIKPRLMSSEYQTDKLIDLVKRHIAGDIYETWFIDMTSLIPDVPADADTDCHKLAPVTYELAQRLDITIDDLIRLGDENCSQDFYATPMQDMLGTLTGQTVSDDDCPCPMFVLSNADANYGASAVLRKEIQDQMQKAFPKGCYFIGSSLHEFLCVPADDDPDQAQELAKLVHSINHDSSIMRPEDILSDHVFQIRDGELTAVV